MWAGAASADPGAEDVAVLAMLLRDVAGVAVRALVGGRCSCALRRARPRCCPDGSDDRGRPVGDRPGCSSAGVPGPWAAGRGSLRRSARSSRCRYATGACSCGSLRSSTIAARWRLRRPAVRASAGRSAAATGCRTSRGRRRRQAWPAGGSGRTVHGASRRPLRRVWGSRPSPSWRSGLTRALGRGGACQLGHRR